jgi:CRISPR/Cas system CSM-associated protein Csm4 (group 5 of RAMP superfamily)
MAKSVLEDVCDTIYTKVDIEVELRDKLLAGIPQSGDMLDYFLKTKFQSQDEKEDFKLRVQKGALTDEEKEEMKETSCCVFEKDHDGDLCIWHGNVKAMIREICSVTGMFMGKRASSKKDNIKGGGRQNYQHFMFVDPLRPKFLSNFYYNDAGEKKVLNEWEPMQNPHGYVDRIKIIKDASGQRTALGRHAFVDNVRLKFRVKWGDLNVYSLDDIKKIFAVAQDDGLGASRSQGFGKFDVIKFEVTKPKKK